MENGLKRRLYRVCIVFPALHSEEIELLGLTNYRKVLPKNPMLGQSACQKMLDIWQEQRIMATSRSGI